ncbi:hypothetical protein [uncultured Alistipes sp.]|uniref:hypothetical protein n=1 Tax=uncultured Alistipes sp. TaxID=538949 RepID=UPI0025F7E913|nr:hypothetical protein [uncultured Alistipes sp.]
MAVKSIVTELGQRQARLIDDHRKLVALCGKLASERDALKEEKRLLEQKIRNLDHELSKMQLTAGLAGGSADKEKARARVNRLMREVDKCIALLNKPQ